jgi:predicted nucleic-acid-binding Zn-ribbon protein
MEIKCPKCGGNFEEGNFNTKGVKLFWTKVSKKLLPFKNDFIIPTTYKCETCGYLESYAKK